MAAMIVATATSAFGQDVAGPESGSLSPPSASSDAIPGAAQDALLPLTKDKIGNSPAFDAPPANEASPPQYGFPLESPADSPTSSSTPDLLSVPGATVPGTTGTPVVSTPLNVGSTPQAAATGTQMDGWESAQSYEQGMMLWGAPSVSQAEGTVVDASAYASQPCAETVGVGMPSGYGGCAVRKPRGGGWARIDMLLWNMDGYSTPALVTRAPGTVVENRSAALGGQGTRVLYGGQELGDDLLLGGRLQFGRCIDQSSGTELQFDFFGLAGDSKTSFAPTDSNIYARPFFNTDPQINAEDGLVFSMPNIDQGNIDFDLSSEVWSVGTTFRFDTSGVGDPVRSGLLIGYRFFRLEESFEASGQLLPDDPFSGSRLALDDRIRTRNDFHGIEFGLTRGSQRGGWCWDIAALCALGEVERVVDLTGSARVTQPGFDHTFAGGFYNRAENLGTFRDTEFAAIPQVRANLSCALSRNCRLSVGYNLLYLSSAVRPGQFLNTTFDGSQLAKDTRVDSVQRPSFRRNDMLLHGATAGVAYSF